MTSSSRRLWSIALGLVGAFSLAAMALFFWTLGVPNSAALTESSRPNEVSGFPMRIDATPDAASLRLTGTALRTWSNYSFYRIGSYCPPDATIESPEHIRDLEAPKLLVLRMLRNIPGSVFSFSFRKSLRNNDPNREFEAESKAIIDYVTNQPIREGDEFRVTYVPGECVTCKYGDAAPLIVKNPAFARVIWGIYFGEYHLGEEIKQGLVSLALPAVTPIGHLPIAVALPTVGEPVPSLEASAGHALGATDEPLASFEPGTNDEPPATGELLGSAPTEPGLE